MNGYPHPCDSSIWGMSAVRSDRFLNEGYYPLPCFDSKRQVSEYFQYLALTVSLAVLQLNVAFHTVTALFAEADA